MQAYVNVRWQSTVNIERKKREERERKGGGVESRGETRGECIRRDFDVKRGGEEEDDHEGGAVYKFNEKERNIPENSRQSKRKKTDVRMYCWEFFAWRL